MNSFFKQFLRKHQFTIIFYSTLRVVSLIQVLFWPYAFAKIVNILSEDLTNWQGVLFWGVLMIGNAVLENIIRLRSKYGLEKVAIKLMVEMTRYFSEKTELRDNVRTGQAIQAIKVASEQVKALVNFYKESGLQLPVNLIVIPIVLTNLSGIYLLILLGFAIIYAIADLICLKKYNLRFASQLKSLESFWGTEYRRVPDVWRKREDGTGFSQQFNECGQDLINKSSVALNVANWRWIAVQTISTFSKGIALYFVVKRILNKLAHVGEVVLVMSYFDKIHGTLNIFTSALTRISEARLALRRLNKELEVK